VAVAVAVDFKVVVRAVAQEQRVAQLLLVLMYRQLAVRVAALTLLLILLEAWVLAEHLIYMDMLVSLDMLIAVQLDIQVVMAVVQVHRIIFIKME
jgi:hypothetical protein